MAGVWLASYVALWGIVLLLAAALVGALRHIGIIYDHTDMRASRLSRGERLPDVTLRSLDGRIVEVSTFSGRPTNFVVISPQCSACHALLTRLAAGETVGDPFDRQVFVSLGDTASANELLKAAGIRPDDGPVLIDEYGALRSKWGVKATPVTLMVDDQMRIRQQVRGSIIIRESPSEAQEKSAPQVFAPVGWLRV